MKRILLTGGNGFIGRNIKEQLSEEYDILAPTSKELDLLDRKAVNKYIKKNKISDIVHSAVYNQRRRDVNAEVDLSCNLKMFYNLVEHAEELDKIIYFGSGAEYDKRYPIQLAKEDEVGKTIPMFNDYSMSKYLMNLQARNSSNIYNLRLFGVYGKYENVNTYFISHLCQCALKGLPLTVRQECLFDFLYVDDVISPLRWVLENKPMYQDYNICSGEPIYLSDIANIVKEVADKKELDIKILAPGENLEYTGCRERICEEMDWELTDIKEGIKKLYSYYKYNKVDEVSR